MRNMVIQLLKDLSLKDYDVRHQSFLHLSLSIESALIPGLIQTNKGILDEFEKLALTESEANVVLRKMSEKLSQDTVPLDIRAGIVWLLGKFTNIKFLRATIKFLQQHYNNLDDQEIYSILTSINPQDFPQEDHALVVELIQKSSLREILIELRKRNNDNVNDAILDMWGKLREINCLGER